MLRAVVVDDEPSARRHLGELLRRTGLAKVVAQSDGSDALDVIRHTSAELVFMDIGLVGLGQTAGLDLGSAVAKGNARLVYVTACSDQALPAFEQGAIDYLLKPVTLTRLKACLARVHARADVPRLTLRRRDGTTLVDVRDVVAIEARERLSVAHTVDGEHGYDLTLARAEAALGTAFLRVHRNWLIAKGRIRTLKSGMIELFIREGETLQVPVSRRRLAEVRRVLQSPSPSQVER